MIRSTASSGEGISATKSSARGWKGWKSAFVLDALRLCIDILARATSPGDGEGL